MFTTSFTAALLGGMMASGSLEAPSWRTSYRDAAAAAVNLRKPIAVFITTGSPAKLVKEGSLGKEAAKLLRDGFVPLTVDTATPAGKELANTFNLTEGLVISDRSGGVQALRHAGGLTDGELKAYLTKYATTTATAATTDFRGAVPAPVTIQPQYQAYQPQYQTYAPQSYQPVYSQPRPILNAMQNMGGFVQNVGQNTVQNVGGFVQNVGGFLSGSS